MKFLVFLSCALAVTSATYYGPQHIPVIGPNGVPVEPLEVQAARANHLSALASARGGIYAPYYGASAPFTAFGVPLLSQNALPLDTPAVAAAKLQHYQNFAIAAQRNGVPVSGAFPVVAQGGNPLDTPEVQVAKAAHFQAHAEAAARASGHFRKRRDVYGGYHIPVIGPNGVPVEPPAVQAARANHLAALTQANQGGSPYQYGGAGAFPDPYRRYYGPQATIGPNGHPIETPEVRAAKAYHFSAYAAALSGQHLAAPGHYY